MKDDRRALLRAQQISTEERAAMRARDTDALCRLTHLLPGAITELERTTQGSRLSAEDRATLDEVREAQAQAEQYLQEQMRSVKLLLQQCSTARRALRAYGRRSTVARVDNRS